MPVAPDTVVQVRYVNGEVTPARPAKWWANWRRSGDAFAIDGWREAE
jgi:hypothetical protein